VTDLSKTKQARILSGDIFGKHEVTDQVADVRLLLAPLAIEDVKTVRCLGLNYEKHAHEVFLTWLAKSNPTFMLTGFSPTCRFRSILSYL
jgi:hypothetical protein